MVYGLGVGISTIDACNPSTTPSNQLCLPPGSPGPEMPAPHVLSGFGVWDLHTLRCTSGTYLRFIRPERVLPSGALEPDAPPVPRDLQVAILRAVQRELPDADSDYCPSSMYQLPAQRVLGSWYFQEHSAGSGCQHLQRRRLGCGSKCS